jgi:hypothetical protein
MTLQQIVEILLAAFVLSAMFGGPVAAVIGLWLMRRAKQRAGYGARAITVARGDRVATSPTPNRIMR